MASQPDKTAACLYKFLKISTFLVGEIKLSGKARERDVDNVVCVGEGKGKGHVARHFDPSICTVATIAARSDAGAPETPGSMLSHSSIKRWPVADRYAGGGGCPLP